MRLNLTEKRYNILLDEFLLNPELAHAVRRWPDGHIYDFRRHCFDYALSGQPIGFISNQSEYAITLMAKYFLTGYQLGVDIDSGVSERYKNSGKGA